jgi:argininosuccinate lyase
VSSRRAQPAGNMARSRALSASSAARVSPGAGSDLRLDELRQRLDQLDG